MKGSSRLSNPSPKDETARHHCPSAERARWIERYQRSGQCQRSFAEAHGLKLSQFRYWLYHPPAAPMGAASPPRWQEVSAGAWASPSPWSAEIALPDGATIRLNAALARDLILPLLQARQ